MVMMEGYLMRVGFVSGLVGYCPTWPPTAQIRYFRRIEYSGRCDSQLSSNDCEDPVNGWATRTLVRTFGEPDVGTFDGGAVWCTPSSFDFSRLTGDSSFVACEPPDSVVVVSEYNEGECGDGFRRQINIVFSDEETDEVALARGGTPASVQSKGGTLWDARLASDRFYYQPCTYRVTASGLRAGVRYEVKLAIKERTVTIGRLGMGINTARDFGEAEVVEVEPYQFVASTADEEDGHEIEGELDLVKGWEQWIEGATIRIMED